jgi:predicted TPR repeat methyltransferase
VIDESVLARCATGAISPEIALAQLLLSGSSPDPAALAARAEPGPLARLADLAERHRDRLDDLSALARAGFDPGGGDPVANSAALFDRLAQAAPEAGVAFYSFGDPAALARATEELVAVIRDWADPAGRRVIDLGCGIGRVALALADEAASVTGVDVSAGMVAEAARRAGHRARVRFVQASGRDLAMLESASADLLLAVDSWPFLIPAGPEATAGMAAEVARVLAPGGDWLLFNWSYRGDPALDEAEAQAAAAANGLELLRAGERPFAIWDGIGFHFRRPA